MSFLARQLLLKSAQHYVKERKNYSKEEIISKINEIKYLSAQKKIPKITLRKEIIHLEQKLQSIFDIEKKLLTEEKRESTKVQTLKKQISTLRARLASVEDKDLQKKVDKLSHLLGECLAKSNVAEDVALTHKVAKELKVVSPAKEPLAIAKVHALESRLKVLKHVLEDKKSDNPEMAELLEEKISLIESRLKGYDQPRRVKHTMIFHSPPPQKKEVSSI